MYGLHMRPAPEELYVQSNWCKILTKSPSKEVGELKRAPREHLEVHFGAVGNILGAIRAPVGAIRALAQHCS